MCYNGKDDREVGTKYVRYIFAFCVCLFLWPLTSHAECNYERVAELSKIAGNVKINYNYTLKSGTPSFVINIVNITDDIYVSDGINHYTNNEVQIESGSGVSQSFKILSRDPNCYGEELLTKYINLPDFNIYYYDNKCKNNSSIYCGPWIDMSDTTLADFYSLLQENKKLRTNDIVVEETISFVEIIKVTILIIILIVIIVFDRIKLRK